MAGFNSTVRVRLVRMMDRFGSWSVTNVSLSIDRMVAFRKQLLLGKLGISHNLDRW